MQVVPPRQRTPPLLSPEQQLDADRQMLSDRAEESTLRLKYTTALKQIESLERELRAVAAIGDYGAPLLVEPKEKSSTSEATPVIVASDWHIEELVKPEAVSGLNRYDLAIAEARVKNFFASSHRLIKLLNQDVKIHNVVLALLGDFISNAELHGGEHSENMQLPPTEAVHTCQSWLIGGIEFLLDHTDKTLLIPCHSGNHARTTYKTREGNENGHSLEYLMYLHLAAYFRGEKRVQFNIGGGYHSYLDVYGHTLRFHHGHAIRYAGGVGGITIPVNKAIAQWDLARKADLDVFGHYHQLNYMPKFVSNGSLIGYNAFALSIKAAYERPQQALFLIDKKRGRTCSWPILMKGDK